VLSSVKFQLFELWMQMKWKHIKKVYTITHCIIVWISWFEFILKLSLLFASNSKYNTKAKAKGILKLQMNTFRCIYISGICYWYQAWGTVRVFLTHWREKAVQTLLYDTKAGIFNLFLWSLVLLKWSTVFIKFDYNHKITNSSF